MGKRHRSKNVKENIALERNLTLLRTYEVETVRIDGTLRSVVTTYPSLNNIEVEETTCGGGCSDCHWHLANSNFCFNLGECIRVPGIGSSAITIKTFDTDEIELTWPEAHQVLEMLEWSNFLCLRVLWNINAMKGSTSLERISKYIVHHHIGLAGQLRTEEKATLLAGPVVTILAAFGLVSIKSVIPYQATITHVNGSKRKKTRRREPPGTLLVIPKTKTLTIFHSKEQSTKTTLLSTFKETSKWLSNYGICAQEENVKITFPLPRIIQEENWQSYRDIDELTVEAHSDSNYRIAIQAQKAAIKLWKESKDLDQNCRNDQRREAIALMQRAIDTVGAGPDRYPFLLSKVIKWEGLLCSQEGKWEEGKTIFEKGRAFAVSHIQNEVDWFEGAIKETEGWLKLKSTLLGPPVESFSEVLSSFEEARTLFEKAGDSPSRDFVTIWIDFFKALKKGVLVDYALTKWVTGYIERDSLRAKERRAIIDPRGTLKVLKPLLMYNHLGQIAQKLEVDIKSLYKKHRNADVREPLGTLVYILKECEHIEPTPEIDWLVKNNNTKKHDVENNIKQEQHIMELTKDPQQLEKVEEKADEYLKAVEQKFKGSSRH